MGNSRARHKLPELRECERERVLVLGAGEFNHGEQAPWNDAFV